MSYTMLSYNAKCIVAKFALATTQEVQLGVDWYPSAFAIASRMGCRHAVSTLTAAGVIAALSPNNKWERNIKDAENVIMAYRHGTDEDVMAVRCCTYTKMQEKALKVLNSATPIEEVLNGPKIIEFYHCITGDETDVCIDGHAYSVWFGERLTMKEVPSIGKKLRERIKQDYKDATAFINDDLAENYLPSQIQAITWVTHKRIYNV